MVGGPPPGFYTDPTGRFEERFFDGFGWTERVRTGGIEHADPPPPGMVGRDIRTSEDDVGGEDRPEQDAGPPGAATDGERGVGVPALWVSHGTQTTDSDEPDRNSRAVLRRYRWWVIGTTSVVSIVIVAIVLSTFGSASPLAQRTAPERTLTGSVTVSNGVSLYVQHLENRGRTAEMVVQGIDALTGEPGFTWDCSVLDGGYSDIRTGAPVLIRDQEGTLLSSGTLGPGVGTAQGCTFEFDATVPDTDMYLVELGRRGTVPFTRDQLDRNGNRLTLSIG